MNYYDYYVKKHKIDVRGLRYPGLISYKALPGGGTTDYAVEIFYEAIKNKKYNCFLKSDTILPMMYIDDAIRGTIELSQADFGKLQDYANFNFAAISFSSKSLLMRLKNTYLTLRFNTHQIIARKLLIHGQNQSMIPRPKINGIGSQNMI